MQAPNLALVDCYIEWCGKIYHVNVSSPLGGGEVYYVTIDNYHMGQIVLYCNGWQCRVTGGFLQGDDYRVILDLLVVDK